SIPNLLSSLHKPAFTSLKILPGLSYAIKSADDLMDTAVLDTPWTENATISGTALSLPSVMPPELSLYMPESLSPKREPGNSDILTVTVLKDFRSKKHSIIGTMANLPSAPIPKLSSY